MTRINQIATLARKMMLTAEQAVALPAVLTKAAESVGMSETDMIARCMADGAVSGYLAQVCRTATK